MADSGPRGVFDLRTPEDLGRKLEQDYERVREDPSDAGAAFDFVVTAWHLLEWCHPNDNATRNRISDANPILRVCEHLAVGVKHFEPSNPKLDAVEGTHRDSVWAEGVWAKGFWAPGMWKNDLVVRLTGMAQEAFGDQLTMPEIAELAMQFWRGYLPTLERRSGPATDPGQSNSDL